MEFGGWKMGFSFSLSLSLWNFLMVFTCFFAGNKATVTKLWLHSGEQEYSWGILFIYYPNTGKSFLYMGKFIFRKFIDWKAKKLDDAWKSSPRLKQHCCIHCRSYIMWRNQRPTSVRPLTVESTFSHPTSFVPWKKSLKRTRRIIISKRNNLLINNYAVF